MATTNTRSRSKRSSSTTKKPAEATNARATRSVQEGSEHFLEGEETLDAALEMGRAGRAAMAAGASDLTRAQDAQIVADRVAVLSDVVATAGVVDMAEGVDLLTASEDVEVMSALVGLMSMDDLEQGLSLARLAGELWAVSDVVGLLQMPI